jgi:outer membrane protein assembly factor BamB
MLKQSTTGAAALRVRSTGLALLVGLVLCVVPGQRLSSQDLAGQQGGAGALAPDATVRMVADEGAGAAFWPRWRGPSGQGVASDGSYPDTWSATENVLWKTPVPGNGNSSPIVWGDFVFLTTAYDGGRRVSVLAYRRSDGQLLWETEAPEGPTDRRSHYKNGHASATPSTDGERIYVSFGARGLFALDFTGKILWRRDLGPMGAYHGAAGSPLLYKDRIILYQDQYRDGFIAAFDTGNGRELWRTPRDASVGWGTPIAIRVAGHDEIIVNSQQRVQAYDPEGGAELWRCRGTSYEVIPTPVVGYGMVFCASGRAGPTLAITPGGSGDVSGTHVAWRSPRGSPFVPSPILYGGQLYMVNDMASIATSLDARTGEAFWQGRLGVAQREGFTASPVAVNDRVFFTNDNGDTFVLRAGRTFDLSHVNSLGEQILASPALVGGRWYFRTGRNLIAIGRPS